MAIATSQVRIANRALILLGSVQRITSVDDGSPLGGQIKDLWHESRRALLAEHPWNIAIHRALINRTDAPAFGYASRHRLPPECLRWLPPSSDDEDWFCGEEEGGHILSDETGSLKIRFIRDVEDITTWPPHLTEALAFRLAKDLCESATQIAGNKETARDEYESYLDTAKGLDARASGNRSRGNAQAQSRWVTARRTPNYRVPG